MTDQPAYIKYTSIELVHPPTSGQEAVWYERANDPELEDVLRSSNFYMIGARPEATFGDFRLEGECLTFDLAVDGTVLSRSSLDLSKLETVASRSSGDVDLELGDKMFRIVVPKDTDSDVELLDWFTVDKLAMDTSRKWSGFENVVIPQELVTFDLLYVGIATGTNSFDRLVKRGHKAKDEILANEPQRFPGARVTDEVYLFFCRANALFIRMITDDWNNDPGPSDIQVVKDLEKAFVSQLKPEYNRERYKSYPDGRDGLAAAGLDRYGYAIAENLVFRTASGQFRGSRDARTGIADGGDLLIVDERGVSIICPTE